MSVATAAVAALAASQDFSDSGVAVGLLVYSGILTAAGVPYWLARAPSMPGWRRELAVGLYVVALVAFYWLWVAWDGDGLLPTPSSDSEVLLGLDQFLLLAVAVPYLMLGLLWGARAVFPALCALLIIGGVDTAVNGAASHPLPALTPYEGSILLGIIATPFILLGALTRTLLRRTTHHARVIRSRQLDRG